VGYNVIFFLSHFFQRCILFLVVLSAGFVSAVYMFITLMITEVIPMTLLFVQFNGRRYLSFFPMIFWKLQMNFCAFFVIKIVMLFLCYSFSFLESLKKLDWLFPLFPQVTDLHMRGQAVAVCKNRISFKINFKFIQFKLWSSLMVSIFWASSTSVHHLFLFLFLSPIPSVHFLIGASFGLVDWKTWSDSGNCLFGQRVSWQLSSFWYIQK